MLSLTGRIADAMHEARDPDEPTDVDRLTIAENAVGLADTQYRMLLRHALESGDVDVQRKLDEVMQAREWLSRRARELRETI